MATKPKAAITPRIWNETETAAHLGMCVTTFRTKLPQLLDAGFPARDQLLRGYDSRAVESWLDSRSGLTATSALATATPAGPSLGDLSW